MANLHMEKLRTEGRDGEEEKYASEKWTKKRKGAYIENLGGSGGRYERREKGKQPIFPFVGLLLLRCCCDAGAGGIPLGAISGARDINSAAIRFISITRSPVGRSANGGPGFWSRDSGAGQWEPSEQIREAGAINIPK